MSGLPHPFAPPHGDALLPNRTGGGIVTGKEFHLISDDRVEEMQTRIAELEEALNKLVEWTDHSHRFYCACDYCRARKVLDHE